MECTSAALERAPIGCELQRPARRERRPLDWLLSSLLPALFLSAWPVRAETPPQDFWNYLVEFGDAQGELFDPSDYAVVVNLPAQAAQQGGQAAAASAQPPAKAAPVTQEQLP